jgi:hypothetical protein
MTLRFCVTLCLTAWTCNAALAQGQPAGKEKPPIRVLVADIFKDQQPSLTKRLKDLHFEVVVLPWNEVDPLTVKDIDVIFLPTQWGEGGDHTRFFEEIGDRFQTFVKKGGGLLVSQPNPGGNGENFTPTLLPYPITFKNWYDKSDLTKINLAPDHFITEDLPGSDMPFPADPILKIDPRYTVLAKQKKPDYPSLAVCQFGDGRIVVQTANENRESEIPISDEILRRMIVWAASREPVRATKNGR